MGMVPLIGEQFDDKEAIDLDLADL